MKNATGFAGRVFLIDFMATRVHTRAQSECLGDNGMNNTAMAVGGIVVLVCATMACWAIWKHERARARRRGSK